MFSQGLRGLVGQSMAGKRTLTPYAASFPVGTWTFTPPAPGLYKLVLWGAGFNGTIASGNGGGSGAYLEKTLALSPQTPVTITVGRGGASVDTVITVNGLTYTASAATGRTGAAAPTGDYDYALAGSDGGAGGGNNAGTAGLGTGGGSGGTGGGGSTAGGAGAPAQLPFRGGLGGSQTSEALSQGTTPGAGGCSPISGRDGFGGDGLVFVVRTS